MWRRSFVATTVALGGTVDDALVAIPSPTPSSSSDAVQHDAALSEIVARLRAPTRPARATALAEALRDIVVAIDRTTLR